MIPLNQSIKAYIDDCINIHWEGFRKQQVGGLQIDMRIDIGGTIQLSSYALSSHRFLVSSTA
jgi:hypothetical protein